MIPMITTLQCLKASECLGSFRCPDLRYHTHVVYVTCRCYVTRLKTHQIYEIDNNTILMDNQSTVQENTLNMTKYVCTFDFS